MRIPVDLLHSYHILLCLSAGTRPNPCFLKRITAGHGLLTSGCGCFQEYFWVVIITLGAIWGLVYGPLWIVWYDDGSGVVLIIAAIGWVIMGVTLFILLLQVPRTYLWVPHYLLALL